MPLNHGYDGEFCFIVRKNRLMFLRKNDRLNNHSLMPILL